MDYKLKDDLNHFFTVYTNNVSYELRSKLPPELARAVELILDDELDLLHRSTMNRLEEHFRTGF